MNNLSEEENEAIIDFEREVEDGRILQSDIILSLDTGIIISKLINKQQKAIEELNEKISKAISHIEACKTTLGNYILTPNEIECLLNILRK